MPTRVLLEGPAIEPLLAQVREEYGSGVRIISADKVRSGGFGGFFAKQHYELSVEVPDKSKEETAAPRPGLTRALTTARTQQAPPQTLEQLLERAESRDRILPETVADLPDPRAIREARAAREAREARAARDAEDAREARMARQEREARERGTDEPPGAAEGRHAGMSDAANAVGRTDVSDTGAAFAELMAGLDRSDDFSSAMRASKPKESQSVRPFRPAQATGQPVNGGAANTPVQPLPHVPSLAELMGGLGMSEEESAVFDQAVTRTGPPRTPAEAYGVPPAAAPPRVQPPVPHEPPTRHESLRQETVRDQPIYHEQPHHEPVGHEAIPPEQLHDEPYDREPYDDPYRAPGQELEHHVPDHHVPERRQAQPPAVRVSTELRPVYNDPVIMNLISVGMPERMASEITGGDTYAGVLSALAHRPAAPEIPQAPGEILVLAGDLAHIVPIGKHLLQQIGLDQTHLLLAGPTAAGTGIHSSKVMHTPSQAKARAEKLQTADSAWIVVMDAAVGETDPIWVNDVCDGLGATAVWAVVDATRKTADSAKHLRALGDVEALVVHNVELTADPATVLGLDLPIVSLDGKPATPHAWAAMLCARIANDMAPPPAAPRRTPRAGR